MQQQKKVNEQLEKHPNLYNIVKHFNLKDKFTQKNWNPVIIYSSLWWWRVVKFCGPLNISEASQQNRCRSTLL